MTYTLQNWGKRSLDDYSAHQQGQAGDGDRYGGTSVISEQTYEQ